MDMFSLELKHQIVTMLQNNKMEARRSTASERYLLKNWYAIFHTERPRKSLESSSFVQVVLSSNMAEMFRRKKPAPTSVLLLEAVGSSSSFNLRVVDVLNRLVGRIPQCFQGLRTKSRRVGLTSSRLQVQEAREEAEHKACRCCVSRGSALRLMEDSARAAMVRQGALALAMNKESIDAEAFACLRSR
jgi:hypothetical protein